MGNKGESTLKKTNKKGFTLVELVVVVAVLLILAAIAIPTVINLVDDARESANEANAQAIETAIKYADAQNEIGTVTYTYVKDALSASGINLEVIEENDYYWHKEMKTVVLEAVGAGSGGAASPTVLLEDDTTLASLK